MKVLIDNTSFLPIVGGTETYSYQLMTSFSPDEIKFQLICHVPEKGPSEINSHPVIRVGDLGLVPGYHEKSMEKDRALGMGRILKDGVEASCSFSTIREAGLEPYYDVVDRFEPDVVLVNDLMRVIGAPFLQHVVFAYDAKLVVNLHGILTSFGGFWDSRSDRKALAQDLMSRSDLPIYFIAPSRYVYKEALEWGVDEGHLKLIYLGVDTDLFKPPSHRGKIMIKEKILKNFGEVTSRGNEPILIGFPSRAVSHKGVDTALEALKTISENRPEINWKFLIAGGASDNPENVLETKKLIQDYDMQERTLVGTDMFLTFPEDMVSFYKACDFCLFPSRREALGYGALESMSCGVPVIGASIPGLSEALGVEPGNSGECPAGWAFAPEDTESLARQVLSIMENVELLRKKGVETRKWVRLRFNLERMITEHIEFFKKIK